MSQARHRECDLSQAEGPQWRLGRIARKATEPPLEDENTQPEMLLVEAMLDNTILVDIAKRWRRTQTGRGGSGLPRT